MFRITRILAFFALMGCIMTLASTPALQAQQDDAPRYLINLLSQRVIPAQNRLEVDLSVSNVGAPASETVIVQLVVAQTQSDVRVLASAEVEPLAFGAQSRPTLVTSLDSLPPGSRQVFSFRMTARDGQPISFVPPTEFALTIPGDASAQPTPATPPPEVVAPPAPPVSADGAIVIRIPLPGNDLLLDLGAPEQLALMVAAIGAGIMMLWLFTVLLRLLFRRPPAFGNQLAPYANMPPLNPNTPAGSHQLWQQNALNNAITVPPIPDTWYAVKRLVGSDDRYLSGWRVTALRMSQYDQYGRVARSQLIASHGIVRQVARLARKSQRLNARQLQRRTQPLGRVLARQFIRGVTRRSAMLPIALDIRLIGTHGEVNIIFQLYHNNAGVWYLVDQWLPDMTVSSKTIYESYTYTLYGQTGGETWRAFRRRLAVDIARALTLFVETKPAPPPAPPPAPQPTAAPTENPARVSPYAPHVRAEPTPDRVERVQLGNTSDTAAGLPGAVVAHEPSPQPSPASLHETNPNPQPCEEDPTDKG